MTTENKAIDDLEDRIMKLLVQLDEFKMRLVKEQNFTDAAVLREAVNVLRLIIKSDQKQNP